MDLIPLSTIRPDTLHWLWPGWLPQGKLTILDGDPGTGKSLITLDICARLTLGVPFPDAGTDTFSAALPTTGQGTDIFSAALPATASFPREANQPMPAAKV